MYTNDAKALGYELSRNVSHPMARQQEDLGRKMGPPAQRGPQQEIPHGMSLA
jgi:hypothetical protein